MSATPIADMLGIDASKGPVRFSYLGANYCLAFDDGVERLRDEDDGDTLMLSAFAADEHSDILAAFLTVTGAEENLPASDRISEARAAIAAQGGAE